jgi:hypothetical protein
MICSSNSFFVATLLLITVQQNHLPAVHGFILDDRYLENQLKIPELKMAELPNLSDMPMSISMSAGKVFSCSTDSDNEYTAVHPLENGSVPGIVCDNRYNRTCKLNYPAGMTSTTIECGNSGVTRISIRNRGRIITKKEMLCKED